MLDRVRRRAWGLSGRLIASCILVTLAVVVLVEALVLGFQVPLLVNGAQLQAQVDAAAKSYAQELSQRYPGGMPAGVAEHSSGRRAPTIALGELLSIALRSGVHLPLQRGAVHQRGHLQAERERLDQHHDGERDENVGRRQPA